MSMHLLINSFVAFNTVIKKTNMIRCHWVKTRRDYMSFSLFNEEDEISNFLNDNRKEMSTMSYIIAVQTDNKIVLAADSRENCTNNKYNNQYKKLYVSNRFIWCSADIIKINGIDFCKEVANLLRQTDKNIDTISKEIINLMRPVSLMNPINCIYNLFIGFLDDKNHPTLLIIDINKGNVSTRYSSDYGVSDAGSISLVRAGVFRNYAISDDNAIDIATSSIDIAKSANIKMSLFDKQTVGGRTDWASLSSNGLITSNI